MLDWHDAEICGDTVRTRNTGRVFRIVPKESKAELWEGRFDDLESFNDLYLANLQIKNSSWHARRARLILQNRASKGSIDQNAKVDQVNDFFLYRFLLNFYKLFINNFDPRQDKCSIEYKKELFNYFLEYIINESKKHNQKVLIITFNHEEDIKSNTSWRYKYVVD